MMTSNRAIYSGPSILIGTPDADRAGFIAETLESWRYQVYIASTGAEALERLESAIPPGAAFLDMDLPSPGAVEVVRSVSMRPEPRRTWLMLMSAEGSKAHVKNALDSGCDDFFAVPLDAADLRLHMRVAERVRGLMGQIQKQAAELRYQTTHDGLTGLWNREALLSLIFQETDRAQRMKTDLCLMLLDLDEFARINQEFGYAAGDRVLAGLANRFRRQLRSYDLIGRCGEDEFLLALPGCSRESALSLAGRISETILAHPFAVEDQVTTLSASFGLSLSRGRTPIVVLREAERALTEAKLAGKNCARFYSWYEAPGLDPARAPEPVPKAG